MSKVFRQYHTWRLPVCLCIEFVLISVVVMLSAMLRFVTEGPLLDSGMSYLPRAFLMAAVCQLCMYYTDLYELRIALKMNALLAKLSRSFMAAMVLLMVVFYFFPSLAIGRGILILSLPLSWCALVGWRILYQQLQTLNQFQVKVLILGTDEDAEEVGRELQKHPTLGYELKGFIGQNDNKVDGKL